MGIVREIRKANPRAHAKRAPIPIEGKAFVRRQSRRPLRLESSLSSVIFHA